MNLKKISISLSSLLIATFISSCGSDNANQLLIDNNVNINAKLTRNAHDYIKSFGEAYANVKDFTGVVTIVDSKTGNPGDAISGDSKFFFKKERNERVEVTRSDDAQKAGTVIAYKGGEKVQVLLAKPIPILGKKFTLSVNDKRIGTSRGLSFNQLDITAMLMRFNKPGVKLDLVEQFSKNGKALIKISGKGTFKDIDNEVTEEVLVLDSATMFPVEDTAFVKDKAVLKISMKDLKTNVGLQDDLFAL